MELVWETPSGQLEGIVFDATPREVHSSGATVTEHALETGANIADHVRPSVLKTSFECFVSDSPVEVPVTQMYGVSGSVRAASLEAGTLPELTKGASGAKPATYEQRSVKATATVLQFDGEFSRVGRVYEQLDRLRKDATLLTATTLLDSLENMVITSLSAPQTAKDGDGITFGLELTQVRFAESQIVEVPDPEEPRARRSTEGGAAATTEQPLTSIWTRAAEGLGFF
jgi:hypothetical protein